MEAQSIIWIAIAGIWTGVYAAILYVVGFAASALLDLPGFIVPVLILFAFWFIPAVYGRYVISSAICKKMGWS